MSLFKFFSMIVIFSNFVGLTAVASKIENYNSTLDSETNQSLEKELSAMELDEMIEASQGDPDLLLKYLNQKLMRIKQRNKEIREAANGGGTGGWVQAKK